MPHVGAIAIDGPKAVGKTCTAQRLANTVLRLDIPEERLLLNADPRFSRFAPGTVLIDEWQKEPELWDRVRRAVDSGVDPGRFLLTGSATPISGTTTHSGAGRILSLRMRPMALFERPEVRPTVSLASLFDGNASIEGTTSWGLENYTQAIASSGLPALQGLPAVVRNQQLDSYLYRIVDRDLPEQGYSVRDKKQLEAWMRSYAAATATQASYSEILDAATPNESAKPGKKATTKYREKLSEIWVLDPLPAWNFAAHPFPRISQGDTHFLADPALAMRLLGLSERSLTLPRNASILAALFEALAVLTVRVAAESHFSRVGKFRTRNGDREIDIIVESQDGAIIPIEVKLAHTPSADDARHLLWLKRKLPEAVVDTVILSTGNHAYRRPDGVAVIPLSLLGA